MLQLAADFIATDGHLDLYPAAVAAGNVGPQALLDEIGNDVGPVTFTEVLQFSRAVPELQSVSDAHQELNHLINTPAVAGQPRDPRFVAQAPLQFRKSNRFDPVLPDPPVDHSGGFSKSSRSLFIARENSPGSLPFAVDDDSPKSMTFGGDHYYRHGAAYSDAADNSDSTITPHLRIRAKIKFSAISRFLNDLNFSTPWTPQGATPVQTVLPAGSTDLTATEDAHQLHALAQRPSLEEVIDGRPGSTLLEVDSLNRVRLHFQLDTSENLDRWDTVQDTVASPLEVEFELPAHKRFFRFRMH